MVGDAHLQKMPTYRRVREGRTYFFTVVTYQRQPILCLDKSRAALREAIADTRASHPFAVSAWVLLPDHMHCIWELSKGDTDYSTRWGLIKSGFTKRAKAWLSLFRSWAQIFNFGAPGQAWEIGMSGR